LRDTKKKPRRIREISTDKAEEWTKKKRSRRISSVLTSCLHCHLAPKNKRPNGKLPEMAALPTFIGNTKNIEKRLKKRSNQ